MHSRKTRGATSSAHVTVPLAQPPSPLPPVALPPLAPDLPPVALVPPELEPAPPVASLPSSSSEEQATSNGSTSPHTTSHRRIMRRHFTSFGLGPGSVRNYPSIFRFLHVWPAPRRGALTRARSAAAPADRCGRAALCPNEA